VFLSFLIWILTHSNGTFVIHSHRFPKCRTRTPDLDDVLKEIYVLYTDCALKDPFYELEMPIRCELFIQAVDNLIERVEKLDRRE
jgi:hypothetical protein